MGAKNLPPGDGLESAPLSRELNPIQRILVVDDEPDIRQLATEVLIHSGYEVAVAADGAVAWEVLNDDNCYDLLIIDNTMPRLTGIELLKKLRAARMALPVIMATGTLPAQEFARSPWLKPAATLLKPYNIEQLLETVKKVLREADSVTAGSQRSVDLDLKENKMLPAGEPAGPTRQFPAEPPRRILVVDEDRDLRLLYVDALARPGYFVDVAEDGAAAWEALAANSYNLLIIENDIPKLTGVELVKKLRSARMAVPVVMAAEKLPTYELIRNPSLQVAATLLKPFAVEVLLDTVKEVLRATESSHEQIAPPPNLPDQTSAIELRPR